MYVPPRVMVLMPTYSGVHSLKLFQWRHCHRSGLQGVTQRYGTVRAATEEDMDRIPKVRKVGASRPLQNKTKKKRYGFLLPSFLPSLSLSLSSKSPLVTSSSLLPSPSSSLLQIPPSLFLVFRPVSFVQWRPQPRPRWSSFNSKSSCSPPK